MFLEFDVADVDGESAELQPRSEDVVLGPTTMPWRNRSALVRDPDGNVVDLFSRPATSSDGVRQPLISSARQRRRLVPTTR